MNRQNKYRCTIAGIAYAIGREYILKYKNGFKNNLMHKEIFN
jgi:hypothetical protein